MAIWNLLTKHAAPLQAAAALLATIITVLGTAGQFQRFFDSVRIVQRDRDVRLPEDIEGWLAEAADFASSNKKPEQRGADHYWTFEKLDRLSRTQPNAAPRWSYLRGSLGHAQIDVRNESNHDVANLRVRLDRAWDVWRVEIEADFLTSTDASDWGRRASEAARLVVNERIVLPPLPALPAGSGATLRVFGRVRFVEVSASGSTRITVLKAANVEDAGLASFFVHPEKLWFLFYPVGALVWLAYSLTAWRFRIAAARVETSRDRAVILATARYLTSLCNHQGAIAVLKMARAWGTLAPSDILRDPKLAALHAFEEFQSLVT